MTASDESLLQKSLSSIIEPPKEFADISPCLTSADAYEGTGADDCADNQGQSDAAQDKNEGTKDWQDRFGDIGFENDDYTDYEENLTRAGTEIAKKVN